MNNSNRKLAAIVFTDIVGYTRLSSKNEPAALELLSKQRELLKPIVEKYNGDWLKEIGDGLLLTFNTSIEAVHCAIEIQKIAKTINGLKLRIGIHQGEVVFQDVDVVGDDVNIASRIEQFSSSGGIAISDRVNASLQRNPEFETKLLGNPEMKGVTQDIKIFSIVSHGLPSGDILVNENVKEKKIQGWNFFTLSGVVFTIIGVLFWINISFLDSGLASEKGIPSVVIFPFENKGDDKDEFYSYGISADIISDITGIGQLRVASLNSIEEMKESGMQNQEIANTLSSRYIVTGTLWKIDTIFQLSIELFDMQETMLVLSERWETKWSDLSLVKSELTSKIIDGLSVNVINNIENEYVVNPDAYELYLKAKHTFDERSDKKDRKVAVELLEKSLSLDPKFVNAKYFLGYTYMDNDRDKAIQLYNEALILANNTSDKQAMMNIKTKLGYIYSEKWETEKALKLYRESYKIANEIGNESSIATALYGLGSFYWERRLGDSARFYWEKSLDIYEILNDKRMLAQNTNSMGLVYWIFDGDVEKTINEFQNSIQIADESGNKKNWNPIANLGIIYHNRRDYKKSKNYFHTVLDYAVSVGDIQVEGFIKYWIGLHYIKLFDYDIAIEYFNESFLINDELEIERWKASSLGGLVLCYKAIGNESMAEYYYNKTAEINKQIVTDFYLSVGFQLMLQDKFQMARDAFFKQLEFEKTKKNTPQIINTLTNIGLSYFFEGEYSYSIEYFNQAIEYDGIENLYDPIETLAFKSLSQKYLNKEIDNVFLLEIIKKKMTDNNKWHTYNAAYMNWALYELFSDQKYIIAAYNLIQRDIEELDPNKHDLYMSYSTKRLIYDSYNKIKNI